MAKNDQNKFLFTLGWKVSLFRKSGSSWSHQKRRKLFTKKIKSFSNPDSRYITQPVAGIEDADTQILYIKSKSWKGKPQTNGLALTRHKNNYIQL